MVLCLCMFGNVDGERLAQLLILLIDGKQRCIFSVQMIPGRCSYHSTFFGSSALGALFLPRALGSNHLLIILGSCFKVVYLVRTITARNRFLVLIVTNLIFGKS